MQERPLNTDDLAGAQGSGQSSEDRRPEDQAGMTDAGATRSDAAGAAGRPDLSVVPGGQETSAPGTQSLLPTEQATDFRERWQDIQVSFVDEPRQAVEQADALVADLLQRLASGFSDERKRLEGQWDRGSDVSTEDLRVALQRYRSFFDRLLAA